MAIARANTLKEQRLPKYSLVFEVLGTIDELNSVLGFLHSSQSRFVLKQVVAVQKELMAIASQVAGAKKLQNTKNIRSLTPITIRLEKKLPKLESFILPGGSFDSCWLHFARTVCRRLERVLGRYVKEADIPVVLGNRWLDYVNKLSYLLFLMARL